MLFTENRYDRSMEQMMKGIPNFHPRGSGIVVTGNFRYTAEMCDCEYCGYYGGKKKGCLVPKCVCLEERISVGVASVKEIMSETMSEIKHGGFIRRLKRYIKESEAIPMTFINEKHRLSFDEALTRLNQFDRKNLALMSALYLLTADLRLWLQTKRYVENHGISFAKLRPKNCSEETYPLYCAAIKNGTLLGGSNAIRNEYRNNVTNKLDGVTIDKTTGTGIFMGRDNDKNIKLDLTKCTIKNAGNSGVILLPRYGDMTVTGCNFENNSAKYGGGIYTQSINQVVVTDSNFKNNKAWKGGGGAIVAQSHTAGGSTLKIVGGLFEGNSSNLIIDDKYAQTNEDLKKGWGGAVWGENLTVEGATFQNNYSNDQAGAIFVSSGMENWRTSFKTSISNCTFEGNKADHVGGAIRVFHIGDRNFIKNCKFTGNGSWGADIFVEYGHGIGDKFFKDWGNTSDANNNSTVVVNK